MKEKDILFEAGDYWVGTGDYWVGAMRGLFHVYKNGLTHATSTGIAYPDLSCAILDCAERAGRPMRAREAVHIAEELTGK